MKYFKLLTFLTVLIYFSNASAGWWIFGKTGKEIDFNYLTINGMSFGEFDQKLLIYKPMLPDNKITLSGQAKASKGKIATIRISLDGKKTWEKVKSKDGAFNYSFEPSVNKKYKLIVEATNTAGRTNDLDNSMKIIEVKNIDLRLEIQKILEGMTNNYRTQQLSPFLKNVHTDYMGDYTLLDQAVRTDFSVFSTTDLNLNVFSFVVNKQSRIEVTVNFSRIIISRKTGQALSDKGQTVFHFSLTDKGLKVINMKFPLIFGLSDMTNVAQGSNCIGNNEVILVDADGNLGKVKCTEAENIIASGGGSLEGGPISVRETSSFGGTLSEAFKFSSETVVSDTKSGNLNIGDVFFGHLGFRTKVGATMQQLPAGTNFSVTRLAPSEGYVDSTTLTLNSGNTYAIKLASGQYAIIEVTSFSFLGTTTVYKFNYKFQPNGTRFF